MLRIGLVGCGDRGSGAAVNALGADKNCKLVAMADAFADRIQGSLGHIKAELGEEAAGKVAVAPDHCFAGLDAAEKLIHSGLIDVVILAEPPHFRPAHLKAAVDAGLQIFCEKPVAVDAPGIRSVMATVEEAKKKNLNLVSGLCWRYDRGVREVMKRVLDGAIGEIKSIQETYLAAPLSYRPRQPQWTEMEHQLRNWQYFVWLSGDFNTEQHVHSLDKASWALREQLPLRAWGVGGRQCRDPKQGNVYDHHAVTYEYPNGVHVHSYCRQIAGCPWDVNDVIVGTKGRAIVLDFRIEGETNWRMPGSRPGAFSKPLMYDVEHEEALQGDPFGQDDQQRPLHGPEHDVGDLRPHGRLHRADIDVAAGDQFQAAVGPEDVRDRRRSAGRARQGRQLSGRHAGRHTIRIGDVRELS